MYKLGFLSSICALYGSWMYIICICSQWYPITSSWRVKGSLAKILIESFQLFSVYILNWAWKDKEDNCKEAVKSGDLTLGKYLEILIRYVIWIQEAVYKEYRKCRDVRISGESLLSVRKVYNEGRVIKWCRSLESQTCQSSPTTGLKKSSANWTEHACTEFYLCQTDNFNWPTCKSNL